MIIYQATSPFFMPFTKINGKKIIIVSGEWNHYILIHSDPSM